MRADDAKSVEQYHVKLIRHEENAALAAQYGMTPALCDDGVSVCNLSAGMDSIEEADAVCQQLNDALEAAGSDDTAEVIQLNSGEAPQFTEPVSRSMLTMMGALKTETGVVAVSYTHLDVYKRQTEYRITIPRVSDLFAPALAVIPAQLFAYYCAIQRGFDPDKPRNLAKSVTVE